MPHSSQMILFCFQYIHICVPPNLQSRKDRNADKYRNPRGDEGGSWRQVLADDVGTPNLGGRASHSPTSRTFTLRMENVWPASFSVLFGCRNLGGVGRGVKGWLFKENMINDYGIAPSFWNCKLRKSTTKPEKRLHEGYFCIWYWNFKIEIELKHWI